MNRIHLSLPLLVLLAAITALLPAPARADAEAGSMPFVVEQTFWTRPGRAEQFIALYRKTRLPVLQAQKRAGHLLAIRLAQPQLAAGKDQWDFRVTLTWKDRDAALRFAAEEAGAGRQAVEEHLREELVQERSEVLVLEYSY
ncbi:hypothetical protein [Luteimonas sp. e5]